MKAAVEGNRSAVARGELVLKRSVYSKTGFTNIITIKGKFQARLQVPGDGRGGTQKRKQYSLPGLFDTAEDAAIFLAAMERDMKAACEGKHQAHRTSTSSRRRRSRTRSTSRARRSSQLRRSRSSQWPLPMPCLCTCP